MLCRFLLLSFYVLSDTVLYCENRETQESSLLCVFFFFCLFLMNFKKFEVSKPYAILVFITRRFILNKVSLMYFIIELNFPRNIW